VACSSEEYGYVEPAEVPITEDNPLRPLSPYGVSKVGQDLLSYQYFKSYGLEVIRTRAFNHTGPRRGRVFVCSNFAIQIVEAQKGLRPRVSVGNLDAVRDFTDVRDTVRASWLALEAGAAGDVYNICSGTGYSIREVLEKLIAIAGTDVEVEVDDTRLRPSDVPLLIGDNSKFTKQTGWRPEVPFDQTLSDILDYWRERI
jgi:GDP-4-dehydro-6-deoxy-D-mannose reductase